MRGRTRPPSKGPNPLTRSYESNGPDVKIRGTAQHIAEKYSQLARDSIASGDPVASENYFQHAEHYIRLIATAQEQLREQFGYQQRSEDDGDEDGFTSGDRSDFGNGDDMDPGMLPQPFEQRPEGERPQRFDRGDRFERRDRQDRPERTDRPERADRPERTDRPERGERPDRGERQDRRERFGRDRGPRQDYQRPDYQRQDQPRQDQPRQDQPRQDQPRQDQLRPEQPRMDLQDDQPRADTTRQERGNRFERPDRPDRSEFRRERRGRNENEGTEASGLPAFLTNPVRPPVAIDESGSPAPKPEFTSFSDSDDQPMVKTRRPRRTRREMEEARAAEAAAKGLETPAAE
jgi:hypothetical protein